MPTFEITDKSGTYEITAPDEATALKAFQAQQGGQQQQPAMPERPQPELGGDYGAIGNFLMGGSPQERQQKTMQAQQMLDAQQAKQGEANGAMNMLQGMTANYGDDISRAVGAPEFADRINREQDQFRQAHPVGAPVYEALGAGVSTTLGGGLAGRMLPGAAAYMNPAGRGMAARAARYAAVGGAQNGLAASGEQNATPGSVAMNTGIGMVAGGLVPVAGKVLGAAVDKYKGTGASKAQRSFARAAGSDNIDDVGRAATGIGDGAMPMDLGPNMQRQAGALAQTPGNGQQIIRDAIMKRQGAAGDRVKQSLRRVIGIKDVDTFELADDIIKQRATVAAPAYETALEAGDKAVWSSELERLSGSPTVKNAMAGAVRIWQDNAIADGFGAMKPGAMVENGGQLKFLNGKVPAFPNLQFWDYTKRLLDDKVRVAMRAGQNSKARTLTMLTEKLRDELDKAVPEYSAARQAYAGPSAILDAIEEGKTIFTNDVTPGQLRRQLAQMGESEKVGYLQGALGSISKTMGTARNDALAARILFDKGWNKEKMQILLGPERTKEILSRLDAEATFTKTRDVAVTGSETAARQAAMQEIGGKGADITGENAGILRSIANMRFGDAAGKVGEKLTGAAGTAMRNKSNAELAKILTDQAMAAEALKRVKGAGLNDRMLGYGTAAGASNLVRTR